MDLTAWLLRHSPPRPLVVTAPGGTAARLAVERLVRERGWRPAPGPASANLLVIAGRAPAEAVERLWHAIPAPRARVNVPNPDDVPLDAEFDAALAELRDPERQRAAAAHPDPPEEIPMADRAADRDGLMLDRLHVPLGPLLPLWPAGLTVHTRLQGDVIQEAEVEVAGGDAFPWPPAARPLDASARLLELAGWAGASATAYRLRDAALEGRLPASTSTWARRVRKSRPLRWLLAGVGAGPPVTGDALTRLYGWLDEAEHPGREPARPQWTVDALPALLAGAELATARLAVASLEPDLEAGLDPPGVGHG